MYLDWYYYLVPVSLISYISLYNYWASSITEKVNYIRWIQKGIHLMCTCCPLHLGIVLASLDTLESSFTKCVYILNLNLNIHIQSNLP